VAAAFLAVREERRIPSLQHEYHGIELLAPAKDLNCGLAAIHAGADSIYMGASRFGARHNASNSIEDISRCVQIAHRYWAKVYVTLNILLRDNEFDEALRLIESLHQIGVDGLIIQDVGLLECDLPPLPLIASTQMHNNTPDKVAFLERVGFHRVILARELTLPEIRSIREHTSVQLECFIHGALCVSYSGQCAMSYDVGKRSGNRGECAQPCRKPYRLVDEQGRVLVDRQHLLCLKDLNLSEHLATLIDHGITSFKIEGRLKDPPYVSNVVAFYRQTLDSILKAKGIPKRSSGHPLWDFEPNLDMTFHRGYTTYFLLGRNPSMASLQTPKMRGRWAANVLRVKGQHVWLDRDASLHSGDGLCFFDAQGELRGSLIHRVQGPEILLDHPEGLQKGSAIFCNHDHLFLQRLRKTKTCRKIQIRMALREVQDSYVLEVIDEDNIRVQTSLLGRFPTAQKPQEVMQRMGVQLTKTGNTIFLCHDISMDLRTVPMVPVSSLNAARRDVIEKLLQERERVRHERIVPICFPPKDNQRFPKKESSYLGNVLNRKAEAFYRRHGVKRIAWAAESGLDLEGRQVMHARYCVLEALGHCRKGPNPFPSASRLFLEDDEGKRFETIFHCGPCEMEIKGYDRTTKNTVAVQDTLVP